MIALAIIGWLNSEQDVNLLWHRILLFPVELYNIYIPELVCFHVYFTLYRNNCNGCIQHVDSWGLNSVGHTNTPHTSSSQLLQFHARGFWQFVPSSPLFPVNISPLSCNLELSASAVLRHQGWVALLHCHLSLPHSHHLPWLFWSLMKVEFNSFFKKNEVFFSQSDVSLYQFCVRYGQSG